MRDKHRPDLLAEVLRHAGGGRFMVEASRDVAMAVEATRHSGNTSTITIKINISNAGGLDSGVYKIEATSAGKLAKPDPQPTIMFGTPDNNLQREDPSQPELPFGAEHIDPETGLVEQRKQR